MQINATEVIESTIEPGVKYTIRLLNKVARAKRDRPIIQEKATYSDACAAYIEEVKAAGYTLDEEKRWRLAEGKPKPNAETEKRIALLGDEATAIFNEFIVPASIHAGLVSIEGLAYRGNPVVSADDLLACGSAADDLIDEVYGLCEAAAGLSDKERGEFGSRTTSCAPVPDKSPSSTAGTASA